MRKTISTEALSALRKGREGFVLVDVHDRMQFAKDHIPGACNVPVTEPDFALAVANKASGSKTRKVVVYGAGPTCDASTKAISVLVDSGFTNVLEYEGGLAAWNEAKLARSANKSAR